MKKNNLKEKLKNNQLTIGSWVTINHSSVIEIMASARFEWIALDVEHSTFDYEDIRNMIAHIQANNMVALVRVSKNEEVVIKRVMDAGAQGIIVPMINSSEDAERVVDYVRYPPQGKRGVGLSRAQNYGIGFDDYKKWLNEYSVIIAQIEHIDGINNLHEIVNVEGIDGFIIGPYDLSASMNKPGKFEDSDVIAELERFKKICMENNKSYGFHVISPESDKLNEKINEGYTFLAFSLDFLFLGEKARVEMNEINEKIK